MTGKKIFLMRHSIPKRCALSTELLPLSEEGIQLAMSYKDMFYDVDKCYTSPYKRASETARILFDGQVIVKDKLHERIVGEAHEDFWLKQYQNHDYYNPGGESLNMVRIRMKSVMDEILQELDDGETALVVSHATAICSYLLNFCDVEVIDAASKSRMIRFNGQEVLHGKFNPTDYFEIEYVNNAISVITSKGHIC